jgi:TonB family protein
MLSPTGMAQDEAAVRVGSTLKAPIKTRHVAPIYPPDARRSGVQGTVIVETVVGVDGRVIDARVLRSIPLLDQAALEAVRQWEFVPTLFNGAPVPIVMTVTVDFTLNGAAPRSGSSELVAPAAQAAPIAPHASRSRCALPRTSLPGREPR